MSDSCCSGDEAAGADEGSQDADDGTGRLNPEMKNPFDGGVDRRRMLQASAAGTATAMAGCLGGEGEETESAPTTYVFNTGDRTVSVIDAEADELIGSTFVGTTASFPANQYGTGADDDYGALWLNVDGGVTALDPTTMETIAEVDTGYGPNYPNLTPDGQYLIVASGGGLSMDPDPDEPEDQQYFRIDADRDSDSFGEITDEVTVGYDGPCDLTLDADGEYAFSVDVNNETLTVLSVDPFEIETRVDVGESTVEGGDVLPFMCTASWDGDLLFVENGEGELGPEGEREGSESIWDVSDPTSPEEVAKITRDDGLPGLPITSEVSPDGSTAYLFLPGAGVGVVDVESREYVDTLDVGGASLAGAWGPNREKLYVPVQSADQVAVVRDREVRATIDVGEAPVGAVASTTRPNDDALGSLQTALASVGVFVGEPDATYCYPDCYCGLE